MNTANNITLSRIFLVPVFMFFLMTDYLPFSNYIALGLFIIAAATDGVDGYVARKYNQVTNFGKFIDPLADKLLITAALISMIQCGLITAVPVIIIIAREFMITSLRIVAIGSGKVLAAMFSGKLKMFVQIVVTAMLILKNEFTAIWVYSDIVIAYAVWLMVAVTVYSGIDYMIKNWKLIDFKN